MTKTTTIKRYKASFYDTDTNELVREFVQEADDFGAFVRRCDNRCEWNEVWYYTELSDEDVEPIDVRGEDETEKMHRRSRADHLRDEVARHEKDIADASAIRSETLKELAELAASEDADYQSIRALADRIARCDNRIEVATAYRAAAMSELYDIESEDAFIDGPVSVRIADDSVSFKAEFLAHDEWNGWALPYFSREELEKVIRHMNKISHDEWHVFCLTTDEYRVTNYSDGTLIEAFKGIDKNGKHVYPIGTGIWSWEVAEVD